MVTHQLVTHFICARPAVRFWNVPHRQSSCAPLRHCRLTRCLAAPSGQDGSQSTALCWFPSYPNQWWGDRGCGPQSSGGLGSLLFSAAVWPRGDSAGPQPGGARCDRYAAPVKQQGGKGISINKETNKETFIFSIQKRWKLPLHQCQLPDLPVSPPVRGNPALKPGGGSFDLHNTEKEKKN